MMPSRSLRYSANRSAAPPGKNMDPVKTSPGRTSICEDVAIMRNWCCTTSPGAQKNIAPLSVSSGLET
eukprot:7734662-Alexandrium_andersonii.AAC.1